MGTRRRIRLKLIGMVAAVILACSGLALATAPVGDWFSQGEPATAQASPAISLSSSGRPGTCVLDFGIVKAGSAGAATCTVANTSRGSLKILLVGMGLVPSAPSASAIDASKCYVSIDGYSTVGPRNPSRGVPISSFDTPIDLGVLDSGSYRAYSIKLTVDASVGQKAQDVVLGISLTIVATPA